MSKEETASVLVRMPKELLGEIDAARGEVPRTVYIRRVLRDQMAREKGVEYTMGDHVRKVVKPGAVRMAQEVARSVAAEGLQLGPTKPVAGSRLKKDRKS